MPQKKTAEKELKIGYILNGQDMVFIDSLAAAKNFKYIEYSDSAKMYAEVKSEKIDAGLVLDKNFDQKYENNQTAHLGIIYRRADMEEFDRLQKQLTKRNAIMVAQRLNENNLSLSLPVAFDYSAAVKDDDNKYNVSEEKEVIGKYAGGLLPYIFIAFCFMGCMYPAIDLLAGEKERGTMETLLITPVNRNAILIGKMIVITTFGLISATLALVGLFLSLNMMGGDTDGIISAVNELLTIELIATLYVLLIPLTIFFTGVMTPISVYSRSFKEAQSIMVPLNIVMVLPAIAGFLPTFELDYTTAFIPIVNVVLATKQIIAGHFDIVLIGITFVSLVLLAGVALAVSYRQFGKESNILRGE